MNRQMYQSLTQFSAAALGAILLSFLALSTGSCVPTNDLKHRPAAGSTQNDYKTQGSVGNSASQLLNGEVFDSLEVEVQPVGEAVPTQDSLISLVYFLEQTLHKPGGVRVRQNAPVPLPQLQGNALLTSIPQWEKRWRKSQPFKKTTSLFLLYWEGASPEDSATQQRFAQAYSQSSVILYAPTLEKFSGGIGQVPRSLLEATVMQHEIGHLLGLVSGSSGSTHEDPQSIGHCSSPGCLMQANPLEAIQLSRSSPADFGTRPPELCDSCWEDLHRTRE